MAAAGFVFCALCFGLCTCMAFMPEDHTITLGVFAGSNWDVPGNEDYLIIDQVIERFEKAHPHYSIEYESGILKSDYSEWLSARTLAGTLPDVFMVLDDDFPLFAQIGALHSLNGMIASDPDFSAELFYPSAIAAGRYNGIQYGIPYESNPIMMFVNVTLLQKNGIDVPAADWSLEDMKKIVEAISQDTDQDGQLDQFGIYNYSWQNAAAAYGLDIFSEDGTAANLTDQRMINAVSYVSQLDQLQAHTLVQQEDFDAGKVAFSPFSYAEFQTYQPYPWKVKMFSQFEWTCIPMPSAAAGKGTAAMDSLLFAINSRSSNVRMAWELVRMLTADPGTQLDMLELSPGLPSARVSQALLGQSSREDSGIAFSLVEQIMESARVVHKFPDYRSVLNQIDVRIRSDASSSQDLELFLIDLNHEIETYLPKQK